MLNAARITVQIATGAFLCACGIPTENTIRIPLHFEGTVSAADRPLPGAVVEVWGTLFVWSVPVASDTTDADGKYSIAVDWNCEADADINVSPGNSGILVATAPGYNMLSSVNMGRTLTCTAKPQRVDFSLERAVSANAPSSSQ